MNRPTFYEGVKVAVLAAVLGSVGFTLLPAIVGTATALRLLFAGLTLAYLLYLLWRSGEATGRVVTLTAWVLLTGVSWAWTPDPVLFLAGQVALIWLVRALYHQPGPLAALLDLGLSLFALAAGLWAFAQAGSMLLAIWTYFLVQALFVAIAAAGRQGPSASPDEERQPDRFQQAHRQAETALRRLARNP